MVNIQELYLAMKIKYFEAGWPLTGLISGELCDIGLVLFISLRDLYSRRYSYRSADERSKLAMLQSLFYCLVQQGFDASQDDYGMTGTAFTGYFLDSDLPPPKDSGRERQLAYAARLLLKQFPIERQTLMVTAVIDGLTRGQTMTDMVDLETRRLARGRLWLRSFCQPLSWLPLSYDLSSEDERPLRELADNLSLIETTYRLPSDLVRRRSTEPTNRWADHNGMMAEIEAGHDPLLHSLHLLGKISGLHSYELAYQLTAPPSEPLPF